LRWSLDFETWTYVGAFDFGDRAGVLAEKEADHCPAECDQIGVAAHPQGDHYQQGQERINRLETDKAQDDQELFDPGGLSSGILARRGVAIHLRCVGAMAALALVFGQAQTIKGQLSPQPDMLAVIGEALGPDALPPKVGVFSNAGWSAQLGYFLRRPYWKVQNLEAIPPVL
jgi:hypothetical protein